LGGRVMALMTQCAVKDCLLSLENGDIAHMLEPEYHQDLYTRPAIDAQESEYGAFQISDKGILQRPPNRGKLPEYADDLDEPADLAFIGKLQPGGERLTAEDTSNVAAL